MAPADERFLNPFATRKRKQSLDVAADDDPDVDVEAEPMLPVQMQPVAPRPLAHSLLPQHAKRGSRLGLATLRLTLLFLLGLVAGAVSVKRFGLPTGPSASSGDVLLRASSSSLRVGNILRDDADEFALSLMTFNLRTAHARDGENGWSHRRAHAADIVNRFAPAVIGTQEGLRAQLAEFHSLLTRPYERFGNPRDGEEAEDSEHTQIFYDTSVVLRLGGGTFWLSDTPHERGPGPAWDASHRRVATWCRFRIVSTQQEFVFVNTHLDSSGATARLNGARLLWQQLLGGLVQLLPDEPLFLTGDFNTVRRSDVYTFLTRENDGPRFHDAWLDAEHQIGNVSGTFHAYDGPAYDSTLHEDWIDAAVDERSVIGGNHIDWIFARPRMPVMATQVITETRESGRYPSDHYPIMATYLFPSAAKLPPPAVEEVDTAQVVTT